MGIIHHGQLLALDTVANLRAAYSNKFKVTFFTNEDHGAVQSLYGKDDLELVDRVRALGVRQFSVAPTNLEDIYLALTGEEEPLDDDPR